MTCPVCQGSGWQLLEREGKTAVVRCTASGSCARVTPVGPEVQVAGTGTDTVLASP